MMVENPLSLAASHERPDAIDIITPLYERRERVDALILNPPVPNDDRLSSDIVGTERRDRVDAIVPQTALAQIGAVIDAAGYTVDVVDAVGMGMSWDALERHMWARRPRYLIIQVATPTLTNDMRAALIGKAVGSVTLAIGAHVTPMSRETLDAYPPLDIVVRGEPELTILDVIQTLDRLTRAESRAETPTDTAYPAVRGRLPGPAPDLIARALHDIHGVAFRDEQMRARINLDRSSIENLDSLPIPLHDRLPWQSYQQPLTGAPYTFVHTSRGCPASCHFCLKHVTSQAGVRHRSADHVLKELSMLKALGIDYIHFDADLFTVKREFIYDLCDTIMKNGISIRWSCNSRVDSVDEAELQVMKQAGCFMIGWAIESGSEAVLHRACKRITVARIQETVAASHAAGIKNWGHFLIGLPGETAATIQQTIALSKRLPLDRALFRIATPHPGTPFYEEALRNGWLTIERWEDYGTRTVLSYPHLSSRQLEYWTRRARRAWSLRPGPLMTFLKDRIQTNEIGNTDDDRRSWRDRRLAEA